MVTVVSENIYTSLEALMWSNFEAKCGKVVSFSILHIFRSTDVNALRGEKYKCQKLEKVGCDLFLS